MEVTDSPMTQGIDKAYQITNVDTEVVEIETSVLPDAYVMFDDLNNALQQVEERFEQSGEPIELKLVKEDENPTLQ